MRVAEGFRTLSNELAEELAAVMGPVRVETTEVQVDLARIYEQQRGDAQQIMVYDQDPLPLPGVQGAWG